MYDLLIVGGGPAGLTAGIYAQRAWLDTLLLEKTGMGGQIALSHLIDNYPGFSEIGGFELMQRFAEHARAVGLKVQNAEVERVWGEEDRKLALVNGKPLEARAIIIASGTRPRKLGVPGEEKLIGRGVSFCATCDGPFFAGREVLVVGGGDSAITEALFLTKMVKRVYLVHRRDRLRAVKVLQERAFANPLIEFVWDSVVEEILGLDQVEGVRIRNVKTGKEREVKVEGVFVSIGIEPNTGFVPVDKDPAGFILTDENLQTSSPGIFAAGDCRAKSLRQVVTAAGDGALAAVSAERYIENLR